MRSVGVLPAVAVVIVALATPVSVPVAQAAADPEAVRILKRAEANSGDVPLLTELNNEIEKQIAADPNSPINHYVHGWLLSHLKRYKEAIAAYDRATELAPGFSDAYYNGGVVLANLGRDKEALAHWNSAAKADPKNVDAWYNAAQLYYNHHQFKEALAHWQKAQALVPNDFQIAKKVLQAFNALHDRAAAAKAYKALIALWRNSDDAQVRALTEVCFDQRDVGKIHVFAYEPLTPKAEVAYTFKLATGGDHLIGIVRLASVAATAKAGRHWVLAFSRGRTHADTFHSYTKLPSYYELWPDVEVTIRKHFADALK